MKTVNNVMGTFTKALTELRKIETQSNAKLEKLAQETANTSQENKRATTIASKLEELLAVK